MKVYYLIRSVVARHANLFLDLAAFLVGTFPVHVGARRELCKRWLFGLLETKDENEDRTYQHDTDG